MNGPSTRQRNRWQRTAPGNLTEAVASSQRKRLTVQLAEEEPVSAQPLQKPSIPLPIVAILRFVNYQLLQRRTENIDWEVSSHTMRGFIVPIDIQSPSEYAFFGIWRLRQGITTRDLCPEHPDQFPPRLAPTP